MRLFQKETEYAGVSDKYVYKIETYVAWEGGCSLYKDTHVASKNPFKRIPKKFLCTKKSKKDKWWLLRFVTLVYAPENYLINNGYKEISP